METDFNESAVKAKSNYITVQAQDMEENKVPVAEDTSEQQVQVANTDSQVDEEQQDPDIPEDQTSRASQDDNY